MRLLKWLFAAVALLLGLGLIVALFAPDEVHMERAIVIDRPPAEVFAVLNDFRRFNDWSPWAAKDPQAKYTWSGPSSGVGARLAWEGDPATVGTGSQEITASVPNERVETALDFGEQGNARARWTLTPEGAGTRVVWGFDTDFEGNLVGRLFGLMLERMLAPDYEAGLASLKRVVEAAPPAPQAPGTASGDGFETVPAPGGDASTGAPSSDAADGAGAAEDTATKDDGAAGAPAGED
jgi:uncharacterized protein YndB with AHSA1/START domain